MSYNNVYVQKYKMQLHKKTVPNRPLQCVQYPYKNSRQKVHPKDFYSRALEAQLMANK